MAVSKRVRYEVLRRDNHSCRYCGGAAPDVILVVDHVVPVALGGSDDPSNLIAACKDCNSGKTSTSPDSSLVADVKSDALRWAAAIKQAAEERAGDLRWRREIEDWFLDVWNNWKYVSPNGDERTIPLPADYADSIHQFLAAGLESGDIRDLVSVAMRCKTSKDDWKYFCGCAWRRIRQAQERAAEIVADQEPDESPVRTHITADDVERTWEAVALSWRKGGFEVARCMCGDLVEFCGDHVCMAQMASLAMGAFHGPDELIKNALLMYAEREKQKEQPSAPEPSFVLAEALERELAEMQAERRRARQIAEAQ